jgi:hypothetical protein
VIRRPTSAEVGLVGQQQKASLESAEWAKEIYHGSTNEPRACPGTPCVRPHIARGGGWARARRPGAQPRAAGYACAGCGGTGRIGAAMVCEVRGLGQHRPLLQLRKRPYPARPQPRAILGRPRGDKTPHHRMIMQGQEPILP